MIIPVRCFTCGQMLASKYNRYLEIIAEKNDNPDLEDTIDDLKKPVSEAFIKLGLKRYCCRRHLLTHIDLVDVI
jgi:DNA-directed RNA polymerase I, II, and III subunit RPABC5